MAIGVSRVAFILSLVLVRWPLAVRAQQAEEPAGYRAAVDDAVNEFEFANFQESLALFERAHALYPNARTLRGIGMAQFELRQYERCIVALKGALASLERPLEGALQSDTEELLARARGFVAEVSFDVLPTVSTVHIDGLPVTVTPGETVVLAAGEHVIEAKAAGYLGERRQISIAAGTTPTVQIALVALPPPLPERVGTKSAASEPADAEQAPPKKRSLAKSPWLWTAAGVVAAGAITGAAIALRPDSTTAAPYGGNANVFLPAP